MYDGMDEAVQTIGIPNVLVVNAEMDEELAYQLTQLLFEQLGDASYFIHLALTTGMRGCRWFERLVVPSYMPAASSSGANTAPLPARWQFLHRTG